MIFIDTSVFIAILTMEADRSEFIWAIQAASRRMTAPFVRLEASIVLANRLARSPRETERQYDQFLTLAEIVEADVTPAVGVGAVACFERFGKGRHPARLNFADCLSYACAQAFGARLLFKGDDFAKTDANAWL